MNRSTHIVVGVTGRAGTGKSTFARMLAEEGADLLDADQMAWEIYAIPEVSRKLKEIFGKEIFTGDGTVDRTQLGNRVFNDSHALQELNSIIHPFLVKELKNRIYTCSQKTVIIDAALLLDWSLADECDLLIGVVALDETCIRRMTEKGITPQRARAVLGNQRSEQDFRARCHVIVENSGSIEDLRRQVGKVWTEKIAPLIA
jgi:dephospho-CoA kinase